MGGLDSNDLEEGCINVSQPGPSFQTQCCQRLWGGEKKTSVIQYRATIPRNWENNTYLDLIVSPGMWNGLHITSVKELCNFLNI